MEMIAILEGLRNLGAQRARGLGCGCRSAPPPSASPFIAGLYERRAALAGLDALGDCGCGPCGAGERSVCPRSSWGQPGWPYGGPYGMPGGYLPPTGTPVYAYGPPNGYQLSPYAAPPAPYAQGYQVAPYATFMTTYAGPSYAPQQSPQQVAPNGQFQTNASYGPGVGSFCTRGGCR